MSIHSYSRIPLVAALVAMVALVSFPSRGLADEPVLHAVIVGDVSPAAKWGDLKRHLTMDLLGVFGALVNGIPESQFRYYPLTLERDDQATPENVLSYLEEVDSNPGDTLLFYFTGHGAADDLGHHFQLAGGKLYRDQLRGVMEGKPARLRVLLTDCCNLRGDGFTQMAPNMLTTPPARTIPIFQSLLFEPSGWVDVNASSPGEGAFFGVDNPEAEQMMGSLFTTALLDLVHEKSDTGLQWKSVLDRVRVEVYLAFKKGYPKGAAASQGLPVQKEQNVYAINYPGMPVKSGPRTGVIVRDHPQSGALVVRTVADSPATKVYRIADRTTVSLRPGNVIVSANGIPVQSVSDLVSAAKISPQLMRLVVQQPGRGDFECLMTLRY